jgi:hypothetical protein
VLIFESLRFTHQVKRHQLGTPARGRPIPQSSAARHLVDATRPRHDRRLTSRRRIRRPESARSMHDHRGSSTSCSRIADRSGAPDQRNAGLTRRTRVPQARHETSG